MTGACCQASALLGASLPAAHGGLPLTKLQKAGGAGEKAGRFGCSDRQGQGQGHQTQASTSAGLTVRVMMSSHLNLTKNIEKSLL